VDTSAAFLEGDDENNNKQLLDHAKRLRDLTKLPGSPAVFVCTHPVKNAAADNLLPRGGGAFLNEVDGNFTLKNDDGRLTLHWQGKIRGCDFEPKHLQLMPATDRRLVDSRGRLMQTILAAPVSSEEARRGDDAASADENTLMITMKTKPRRSLGDYAKELAWHLKSGAEDKKRVSRALERLAKDKLVEQFRGKWRLTSRGEKEVA
jgi:hypothetical protein